jgi:hypothetical protein
VSFRDTLSLMRRAAALYFAIAPLVLGCSADAAFEPEPTLETPGAFVALENQQGTFDIVRTLASIEVGQDEKMLFFKSFVPSARDFDEARELARDPALPVSDSLVLVQRSDILELDWKVVWFRSLSQEERDVLR